MVSDEIVSMLSALSTEDLHTSIGVARDTIRERDDGQHFVSEVHLRECWKAGELSPNLIVTLVSVYNDALAAIVALIAERDRARDIAVQLEQENALLIRWYCEPCPRCGIELGPPDFTKATQ